MKTIDALSVGEPIWYRGSQAVDLVKAGFSEFLVIDSIGDDGRLSLAEHGTDRVLLRRVRPESVVKGAVLEVHPWNSTCSLCGSSDPSGYNRCGNCDALFVAKQSMRVMVDGPIEIGHVHPELPEVPA